MFRLLSKRYLVLLSVLLMQSSLFACGCCDTTCNRKYIGVFGGGLFSTSTRITQMGVALFEEAVGGPLTVEARGHAKGKGTGFGGLQLGYEWSNCNACSCFNIATAAELEAYWYSHTKKGHLSNQTDTQRLPEHDFEDTFPIRAGVILANAVFSLDNCWCFSPYLGLGLGATRLSIRNATSTQVAPPEAGVNHFNADTSDESWTFAAQVKLGLRYKICGCFHIFGEYRYLYTDFSKFVFGSTVYPTHAHTTAWNVKIRNIQYNAFALGIRYDF